MKISVNLSGFDSGFADEFAKRMEKGVENACEQVKTAAMANLKGDARGKHLMSAFNVEVQGAGAVVTGRVGVGGATDIEGDAGENFGIYVHEGTGIYSRSGMGRKDVPWFYMDADGNGHITSGMQPNPYLENAYNSEGGHVAQIIADAIGGGG